MVTLHHFSTPTWLLDLDDLAARPGWEDPAIVDKFARWSALCAAEFGGEVDRWVTVNQSFVVVTAGYLAGVFPPGKTGQIDAGMAVLYNMIEGHARAYDELHAND